MRSARVFLSSTFLDFGWEREVLNRSILPDLNAELAPTGASVDLVDLRFGVSDEAGLDHAAVDICTTEVERCCTGGARPAFIFLHAAREGWRPLPRVLTSSDFNALVRAMEQVDRDAVECLYAWYRLDENFVPPSYALRSRRGNPEAATNSWSAVEDRIRRGVNRCGDAITDAVRQRFVTPITRIELECALRFARDRSGLIAAMRRLTPEGASAAPLDESWRTLEAALGEAAVTLPDTGDDDYRQRFREWIHGVLLKSVTDPPDATFARAAVATADQRPGVRRRFEDTVAAWLDAPGGGVRLIYGTSGSGKTTIARRLHDTSAARGERSTAMLLGNSDTALDTVGFLTKAAEAFLDGSTIGGDRPADVVAAVRAALASESANPELILVDALEHVAWQDPSESLSWLPIEVGSRRKIVLTTASEAIQQAFSQLFGPASIFNLLEMDDDESERQILGDLAGRRRTLQPAQVAGVVASTRNLTGRALVNRIAASLGRRLAGDAPVPAVRDLSEWIREWLRDLAVGQGHGDRLVTATLALVCASRRNIAERDLFGILAADEELKAWVRAAFPHVQTADTVPRTVFSRLVADLEGVLHIERGGAEVSFGFAHGLLRQAIADVLPPDALASAHRALAMRYVGEWQATVDPERSGGRLSELPYQLIKAGPSKAGDIVRLVAAPDFIAAKTAPAELADTVEDVSLLRSVDAFGDPVLREFCELIVQDRVTLRSLPDWAERRAYIIHAVESMLPSNPLRGALAARMPATATRWIRPRLSTPRMRGLAQIDAASGRSLSLVCAFDDELVIGQDDGSIAVVGATYGETRRRLPGHANGEFSGARLGGRPLPGNRLLSWGADGDVAVSSVSAGRDVLRMRTGSGGLQYAAQTPSGGVIACSYEARAIYKCDADGRLIGRINVEEGDAPHFTMTDSGLQPGNIGMRREMYLPAMPESANAIMPGFKSSFLVLDDDRVAIGGMGSLSIWSFRTLGPEILIDQLADQDMKPKHLAPAPDGVVVATAGGAVVHLRLPDPRIDILLPPGRRRGGADPLDDDRLFAWSLGADGIVRAIVLDRKTGAVRGRYELHADSIDGLQYFRGGTSNVPRGVLVMDDHLLGWSGYGCEAIDLERGTITRLATWLFSEYASDAVKVTGSEALLLKAGRPTLYNSSRDSDTHDFSDLSGEFAGIHDLGGGRVIAVRDRGACFYWNVPDSVRWVASQNWGELGAQPRAVLDARVMRGGHLAVQHRARRDSGQEFEFWDVNATRTSLAGRAYVGAQSFDEDQRQPGGFQSVGPLLATWGGPPPVISLSAAPSELIFMHMFASMKRIDSCALFLDAFGTSPFAVSAIVCADEHEIHVVGPESGLSWPIAPPDSATITAVIANQDELIVATQAAVWRAVFPGRLPRDPQYLALASAESFAEPGFTVTCEDVIHQPGAGAGLAVFTVIRARDDSEAVDRAADLEEDERQRRTIVAAYALDKGVVRHEVFTGIRKWSPHANGVVLYPADNGTVLVGLSEAGDIEVGRLNDDDRVEAPSPSARHGWSVRTAGLRRSRPLIEPHHAARFAAQVGPARLVFEPRRVSVEHGGTAETWHADEDFVVLDADERFERVLVRTTRGVFQILDLGVPTRPTDVPVSAIAQADAAVDLDLLRLLRRSGRPDLAVDAVSRWLHKARAGEATSVGAAIWAALLVEAAADFVALGDLKAAARARVDAESAFRDAGVAADATEAITFDLIVAEVTVGMAILTGDVDGVAAAFFPAEVRSEESTAEQHALFWIDAVLSLCRRDTARVQALAAYHAQLTRAFEAVGVLSTSTRVRAGLDDIGMLLSVAAAGQTTDISTVDWDALLGEEHAAMLAAARGGDARASTDIGALFGRGAGVVRNPVYAAFWYQRAIDAGGSQAAMNLAQMYRHGEGVAKDLVRGFELTRLAAERGLTPAKANLGAMLMRGDGCEKDAAAARRWLQEAADEGDDVAPLSLALLYATGEGGPRDLERARAFVVPLANRGDVRAAQVLQYIGRLVGS